MNERMCLDVLFSVLQLASCWEVSCVRDGMFAMLAESMGLLRGIIVPATLNLVMVWACDADGCNGQE
jgi:hypothetical protein